MMVVVVDIRKPLCIKGKSLQLTYNQKLLAQFVRLYADGCTPVVMRKPYKTRLSAHLQLQQQN